MYLDKESYKIFYKDSGEKDKPVIIFIHGFPLDHTMWENSYKYFQKTHRTIAYDIRGLGKSTLNQLPFTFEFLVDDLFDLMNHLDVHKVILAGLSMGGYIALRAAQRKPEKFSAMVLCNTQPKGDNNQSLLGRYQNIRIVNEQGIDVLAKKFLHAFISQATIEHKKEIAEAFLQTVNHQNTEGILFMLTALATRTDTSESLSHLTVPVLVVSGENDSLTPPTLMKEMVDQISGCVFKIIPSVGHISVMENPEAFNAILEAFLINLN